MAAIGQQRLVNKQFNTPIGLYSQRNVQEVLDNQLKQLSNGTIGIDFSDPSTGVPSTLAKSAVLRALEEEERGTFVRQPGLKRVAWPPPPEENEHNLEHPDHPHPQHQQQADANTTTDHAPVDHPHPISHQPTEVPSPKPKPIVPPSAPSLLKAESHTLPKAAKTSTYKPVAPPAVPFDTTSFNVLDSFPTFIEPKLAPKGWKSVHPSFLAVQKTPSGTYTTAVDHTYLPPPFELNTAYSTGAEQAGHQKVPSPHSVAPQKQHQQQLYQPKSAPAVSHSPVSQYPGLITHLRKSQPINQAPSPVFSSQPAAAKFRGGSNMRGDLKWPPAEYKAQAEEENEERRRIAAGPAVRPRKAHKDYTQFFGKHALNSTYPGYKAPPGTQHYACSSQM